MMRLLYAPLAAHIRTTIQLASKERLFTSRAKSRIEKAIEIHRRHAIRVDRLRRSKTSGAGHRWTAPTRWLRFYVAMRWERRARERLLALRPRSADDAERKVLYLIAAMMTGHVHCEADELKRLVATLEDYKTMVSLLLGSVK